MAFFLAFSGHALTSKTTRNAIQGSAPYLTFDGGRTRAVDANGLLGITLSNGTKYTPSTNTSSYSRPIVLPVTGQSFADIGMLVPTDTNSVALSSLIGPPNNYWGDDDGDSDVTVTGTLSLSIVDRRGQSVSRDTMLTTCNNSAPYRVTLTSTDGTLSTRYGVPNSRHFSASNVTYYINPKLGSSVCVEFARPNLQSSGRKTIYGWNFYFDGPEWQTAKGFRTQSTAPSSYYLNFPTTGANGLYFDLDIAGSNQALSWAPVTHSGITATMSNSSATGVRVTLSGPAATTSQQNSNNPGSIPKPSLPQTFELVGRDSNGNVVVKYGFSLKKWFVGGGRRRGYSRDRILSWCQNIGYRLVNVRDLTNASCRGLDAGDYPCSIPNTTPSPSKNHYQRRIGGGFFSEWGIIYDYSESDFGYSDYWVSPQGDNYYVQAKLGEISRFISSGYEEGGICTF